MKQFTEFTLMTHDRQGFRWFTRNKAEINKIFNDNLKNLKGLNFSKENLSGLAKDMLHKLKSTKGE